METKKRYYLLMGRLSEQEVTKFNQKWIAVASLKERGVVASGDDVDSVRKEAMKRGFATPETLFVSKRVWSLLKKQKERRVSVPSCVNSMIG